METTEYFVIQNTKINTVDFRFLDPESLTYPVPPLVSARLFLQHGVRKLKINATLYINSKDSQNPSVGIFTENDGLIEIYFDYDYDDKSPETYDVWYVEIEYTSDTVQNVTKIISYLRDLDPETSRGTSTVIP